MSRKNNLEESLHILIDFVNDNKLLDISLCECGNISDLHLSSIDNQKYCCENCGNYKCESCFDPSEKPFYCRFCRLQFIFKELISENNGDSISHK